MTFTSISPLFFIYNVLVMIMLLRIKKKNIVYIIIGIVALFVFTDYFYYYNRLFPGVYLKDIDLGGKTLQEVEEILDTARITFYGPDEKSLSIPVRQLGIEINVKKVFETGYWQGRPKPWPWVYRHRLKIRNEGAFIPVQYDLNRDLLSQQIDDLTNSFRGEQKNAYFRVSDNSQVEIIPEKASYNFNAKKIEEMILENLAQAHFPLEIKVPYTEKMLPDITISSLQEKGIDDLMVSFTTAFDPKVTDRVYNLKLASAEVNNYFIAPGEVFSLIDIVGDTTEEKGYRSAPVIVGGELSQGIGGGLCQVSSTLYNVALLANIEIVERHNHHLAVSYIDPGRDATISYPSLDLKFRNNKDHDILITSEMESDKLTFRFFGRPVEEKVEVFGHVLETFSPSVKYEYAPDLDVGEEEIIDGIPGYLVEVWKKVYLNDHLESEEKISTDRYLPHPQIIRQGPQ